MTDSRQQMTKRKVAIFDLSVTSESPAGSCILQMIRSLHKDYEFVIFSDKFDNPDSNQIEWVRVPLPEKPVFLRYMIFNWFAPQYYRNYINTQPKPHLIIATEGQFSNCDICYAHFCHKAYLKRHVLKASFPRKLARLIGYQFNATAEKKAFSYAKAIVVPSKGLANELTQTYGALVQRKIIKLSNPVDVERFTRPSTFDSQSLRSDLGFSSDDLIIVFAALGDFDRKGLEPLLKALSLLNNPDAKLLVVGGSQTEIQEYQSIRDRLGLTDDVVFVGFQTDIRPFLWISNLFAIPSSYETFSLVTFQAAIAGLPVIATKLYGIEEFLEDGVNGWLIERNVDSIINALKNAVIDKQKLFQMGISAHKTACQYDKSFFIEYWKNLLSSS